jgi:hypothetical protein
MSPFAVKRPISVSRYEQQIWDTLLERLVSMGYSDEYIAATSVAFGLSAEIHRKERRRFDAQGWGKAKEPYIGHPSRMLYMALDKAYRYPHPYALTATILNHDTQETLAQSGFGHPIDCVKYIVRRLEEGLRAQKLGKFAEELDRTAEISFALYRDPREDYYETGRKIMALSSIEDALLGFEAKELDRGDNSRDLLTLVRPLGYGTLMQITADFRKAVHSNRSVFKTIIIMNDSKVFSLLNESQASYELLENARLTTELVGVDTYAVLDKITNTLQNYTYNRHMISEDEGRMLRVAIFKSILDRESFYETGGFEEVTKTDESSPYHGTIIKYNQQIEDKIVRRRYNPDPIEIYRDSLAFKKLIQLLVRRDRPEFYIKGMGLATSPVISLGNLG